ncbi:M23 family metallopeptidase [Sphingomonas sp.]|uniref:M23 family metallopeptidase n=1 Tax=Sphingomonas sp. TaxID=28214 RepID=UPI00286E1C3B|nr:M23 family metallopeptidase [Sphingomonas sp.]
MALKALLTLFADKDPMFHAREDWSAGAAAVVPLAPAFGRRRAPFALAVDLAEDMFTRRWWRGAATLAALLAAAGLLAPGFEPLPSASPHIAESEAAQAEALGISPLGRGGRTGLQMAPGAAVEPLGFAPERATIQMFMKLGPRDSLGALLARAGTAVGDARAADALVRSAAARLPVGTAVDVTLGRRINGGARPLEHLSLRAGLALRVAVERGPAGLRLVRHPIAIDTTPLRVRGKVGAGFYWSLRAAGVSPSTAADFLRAIGSRLDVGGDVAPGDRFDLIIANRRAASGESEAGPLLYAALDRASGDDVQLMKWTLAGRTAWLDANADAQPSADAMMSPVPGPVTSGFGMRRHPILRFARMHRGVDFGAGWGTPIVAAADGVVSRAGWAGGYGRQVRIAHGGGLTTSYSHMSRMAADPGSIVRQGQVIGFVGSSGLSTGPHLHYEVLRGGVAVNPLSVRFAAARAALDGPARDAFKARLKALLAVGTKRG